MILSAAGLGTFTSCDVHEWPELEYGEVPFVLNLQYQDDMPLYKEITYTRAGEESSLASSMHDVRYLIHVYPAGSMSALKTRGDADLLVKSFVFTAPYTTTLDKSFTVDLPEGEWDIYVWTDFSIAGTDRNEFYNTSDWAAITYSDRRDYVGSTHWRRAFRGMTTVTVNHPYRYLDDQPKPDNSATVEMLMPMARYEFISTDVEEFLDKIPSLNGEGKSMSDAINGNAITRSDLEEFKVVFRYPGYMPSVYNIFTNQVTDAWTGMSFESSLDVTNEGILLGFDYVLLNDREDGVNVSVEVYNGMGEKIASTPSIEVPILRGKYTVVKGDFLTTVSEGGVGVDPGYDGEYNIEIK